MTNYRSIKIPEDLIIAIKKLIKDHKELGYRTHSEFIINASRKFYLETKKLSENNS